MNKNKAVTLVELIVAMFLLSFLSALGFRVFSHFQSAFQRDLTGRLTLQTEALRAAEKLFIEVKKGTEIVLPMPGQTLPYFVYKDIKNLVCIVYPDNDIQSSKQFKKTLMRLISYVDAPDGNFHKENLSVIINGVERVAFTGISPVSVQFNLTLANDRQSFEFLSHVGVMNMGDLR
ncbi:MAG: type II secretion system protein [Candidatus Riflebacteria bacterium]|nr:type II secretion system protein [Candidatus Riflebacteria bacterium]